MDFIISRLVSLINNCWRCKAHQRRPCLVFRELFRSYDCEDTTCIVQIIFLVCVPTICITNFVATQRRCGVACGTAERDHRRQPCQHPRAPPPPPPSVTIILILFPPSAVFACLCVCVSAPVCLCFPLLWFVLIK